MSDPIIALATGEILKLAFNEFIKAGAGETAKKLTGRALDKARELRYKIVSRFQNKQDKKSEKAIVAIQEHSSLEALQKLTTYLDDEMKREPIFAQELQEVAEQIVNIQSHGSDNRQYTNYGRDQIYIENLQGNPKIGSL